MMFRFVFLLLIVVVVIAVFFGPALVRRVSSTSRQSALDEPREILKRRYAAGEIDEDEYLRRMSGLSQEW